jgi:uncharacterized protein (TIGR03083 family)
MELPLLWLCPGMTAQTRTLIANLRALHDDLAAFVLELSPEKLRERSYDTEWTVADVLSHLGSGSELTLLRLRAEHEDAPTPEDSAQVWAKWSARTPEQQAVEAIGVEEEFVATLERLDDAALAVLHQDFGGLDVDPDQSLRLRSSEQAMHSWDIFVMFDDNAVLPEACVPGLLDVLPITLRFAGQPHEDLLRVRVKTTDPERDYLLYLAPDATHLTSVDDSTDTSGVDGELMLPAEALLRLVYGRLDPRHTPPHKATDDTLLEKLRVIFRGF